MGFWDQLFGEKKDDKTKQLKYSDLEDFLKKELEEIQKQKQQQAQPIIKKIEKTTQELEKKIKELDQKKLHTDIDKRLHKILKTNKPDYVKTMQRITQSIKEHLKETPDTNQLNKKLKEELDLIGKANFGDGRYIVAAFQDEMIKIQTQCKNLLDHQEQLTKEIEEDEDEQKIRKNSKKQKEINQKTNHLRQSKKNIEETKEKIKTIQQELKQKQKQLEQAIEKTQAPQIKKMQELMEQTQKQKKNLETQIHSDISSLKRALKKFKRYSLADDKTIQNLLDNPFEGFLKTETENLHDMLKRLEDAVDQDKIDLKSDEKTIQKIKKARKDLTEEIKNQHNNLKQKEQEIKKQLSEIDVFEQVEKLKTKLSEKTKIEQELAKTIEKEKEEIQKLKKQINEEKEKLLQELKEHGVNVKD